MPHARIEEERLDPDGLRRLQEGKLRLVVEEVLAADCLQRRRIVSSGPRVAVETFTEWPFTFRSDLEEDQTRHPPYGTALTRPPGEYNRLHQTSGSGGHPLFVLDTPRSWDWWKRCWEAVFRAAELGVRERIAFTFSFGPFIGFWSAFESAAEIGHLPLPCGSMTTLARLRHVIEHRATVVCCTPTYALRMAEVATEQGIDLARSAVRALIVAGEPGGSIPETRARIERSWGARVFDHAGMTEVGAWGMQCAEDPNSLHVLEHEFIAEVIDPRTGLAVRDGEPGELVLTNLGRYGFPVPRYRTGDRVVLKRGRCACGRWLARVEGGVLGRTDDMLLIRGNNVFPSVIEGVLRGFGEVIEFQIRTEQHGALVELWLDVETTLAIGSRLETRIADAVRDRLHFRPMVNLVPPGTLPRFEMKARRVIRTTAPRATPGGADDGASRRDE
jgi:phenylacetate-CoA ligase